MTTQQASALGKRPVEEGLGVRCVPPAMVALMRVSSSSSPRMASCKWRGVIRFTRRSREAFPASSSTSAQRYSQIAAMYTAEVAPTRPWRATRFFRCLWIRPTGNCSHRAVPQGEFTLASQRLQRRAHKRDRVGTKSRGPGQNGTPGAPHGTIWTAGSASSCLMRYPFLPFLPFLPCLLPAILGARVRHWPSPQGQHGSIRRCATLRMHTERACDRSLAPGRDQMGTACRGWLEAMQRHRR